MFRSSQARLPCTLLACWSEGYEHGWFVLSDLPHEQATVAWYGPRSWIERSFKHIKSGGWNWQETRMTDPARVSRQWLAMAVASVLLMRQGTAAEQSESPMLQQAPPQQPRATDNPPSPKLSSPQPSTPKRKRSDSPTTASGPRRILSVFRKGLILVQAALLANMPLPQGRLAPEPWPQSMSSLISHAAPAHPP